MTHHALTSSGLAELDRWHRAHADVTQSMGSSHATRAPSDFLNGRPVKGLERGLRVHWRSFLGGGPGALALAEFVAEGRGLFVG